MSLMKVSVSLIVGQAQEHLIRSFGILLLWQLTLLPGKVHAVQQDLDAEKGKTQAAAVEVDCSGNLLGHWINHRKAMYNFGIPGVRSNLPNIYWSQWWVEWGWEVKRCMVASTWGKPLRAPPLQGQRWNLGVQKMHGSSWERPTIWGDAVEGNHHVK